MFHKRGGGGGGGESQGNIKLMSKKTKLIYESSLTILIL